jgi:hypothetical protein
MQSSEKGSVLLVGLVSVVLGLVVGLAVSAASKPLLQDIEQVVAEEVVVVPRADTKAADFRVATALLFQQHVHLISQSMRETFEVKKDQESAVGGLLDENVSAVVQMIQEYYGEVRGKAFETAWVQHVGYLQDYAVAKRDKSKDDVTETAAQLEDFADGMAEQLSIMNPHMSRDVVRVLMFEYVRSAELAMDLYAKGEMVQSYQEELKTQMRLGKVVDLLVNAIVKQNPEKF